MNQRQTQSTHVGADAVEVAHHLYPKVFCVSTPAMNGRLSFDAMPQSESSIEIIQIDNSHRFPSANVILHDQDARHTGKQVPRPSQAAQPVANVKSITDFVTNGRGHSQSQTAETIADVHSICSLH